MLPMCLCAVFLFVAFASLSIETRAHAAKLSFDVFGNPTPTTNLTVHATTSTKVNAFYIELKHLLMFSMQTRGSISVIKTR